MHICGKPIQCNVHKSLFIKMCIIEIMNPGYIMVK